MLVYHTLEKTNKTEYELTEAVPYLEQPCQKQNAEIRKIKLFFEKDS